MSTTVITPGYVAPAVVTLTDAPTISVNAAAGNDFRVTISGNRTMAGPINAVDGQRITFQVTQGGAGNFQINWDSTSYKWGAAGNPPALSTAAGDTDVIGFIYNASMTSWLCVGAALGF